MGSPWKVIAGLLGRGKSEASSATAGGTDATRPHQKITIRLVESNSTGGGSGTDTEDRGVTADRDKIDEARAPHPPLSLTDVLTPELVDREISNSVQQEHLPAEAERRANDAHAVDTRPEGDHKNRPLEIEQFPVKAGPSSDTIPAASLTRIDVRSSSVRAGGIEPSPAREAPHDPAVMLEMEISHLRSELSAKLRLQNAELTRLLSRYDNQG